MVFKGDREEELSKNEQQISTVGLLKRLSRLRHYLTRVRLTFPLTFMRENKYFRSIAFRCHFPLFLR